MARKQDNKKDSYNFLKRNWFTLVKLFFEELFKTIRGDYRNWEEKNGFVQSDLIRPNDDLRIEEREIEKIKKIENTKVEQKDIFESITGHDLNWYSKVR